MRACSWALCDEEYKLGIALNLQNRGGSGEEGIILDPLNIPVEVYLKEEETSRDSACPEPRKKQELSKEEPADEASLPKVQELRAEAQSKGISK